MRENLSSAENQQERSKEFWRGYVVGLVDAEGCFHVAFQRRADLPLGISIIPEFQVSQNEKSKKALEQLQTIFGCGYIKPNHRHSRDTTLVYIVRDRIDLLTKIIPFLEINLLVTEKQNDFRLFARIVRMMNQGEHQKISGIEKIINLAYQMNNGGKRRKVSSQQLITLLKSSETIRKTPTKSVKT
jgi:hypothetical protein